MVVVLAVGCGASGNEDSTGAAGSTGSEASPSTAPGGTASGSGRTVQAGDAGEAIVWGDHADHAEYGVVMSHGAAYDAASWAAQGTKIADNGMVALAVEDNSADSLAAAARYLTQQYGVEGVALMGASASGQTAIQAAAQHEGLFDRLILLSPAGGDVSTLGDCPKLFAYSEDEALAGSVQKMAQQAPGEVQTVALPGSAHAQAIFEGDRAEQAMTAIMDQLESGSSGSHK